MIRQTLATTQDATFSINIPNPSREGMPTPRGTGYFVSADGLFVTAAHVVTDDKGQPLPNLDQSFLMKEGRGWPPWHPMVQWPVLVHLDPRHDFAELKCDFEKNRDKTAFKDRDGFPHLTVGVRQLEEGEPVYSFGYPLSGSDSYRLPDGRAIAGTKIRPRVTSAIVASTLEERGMVSTPADVQTYVLDKALNYGNSGGPIVAAETGYVHAFCSRFQPVYIPQGHWPTVNGQPIGVMMPSLYGVVISLANPDVLRELRLAGADISGESAGVVPDSFEIRPPAGGTEADRSPEPGQ